ncbi:uncharacterized protein ARMOST_02437 [Armillaria ostoyae]|uniref:Uncharacterized protein n=1 Tax=Armillaria ostoyae TaxID=47428 RepID=A0A284QRP6_ARMOS|nr:uncharacterized protein ARMOST_02437 [Armillaria ostoyae]
MIISLNLPERIHIFICRRSLYLAFAFMILPQFSLFSGRDGIVSILDASFCASGSRGDSYDAIDDGLLIREKEKDFLPLLLLPKLYRDLPTHSLGSYVTKNEIEKQGPVKLETGTGNRYMQAISFDVLAFHSCLISGVM